MIPQRVRLSLRSTLDTTQDFHKFHGHTLSILWKSISNQRNKGNVIVGKTVYNHSTKRNTAKRQLRSIATDWLQQTSGKGIAIVLIARRPIQQASYAQIKAEFEQLVERITHPHY